MSRYLVVLAVALTLSGVTVQVRARHRAHGAPTAPRGLGWVAALVCLPRIIAAVPR